ncbi:MAG: hypothetical protein EOP18_02405, partial [Rhizobiaceae bacterium]
MRNYVGLASTYHDPAIAIVDSKGAVVFAEGAERYLQNKRAIGVAADDPVRIKDLLKRYCEPDADIVFARTWNLDWTPEAFAKVHYVNDAMARASRGDREGVTGPLRQVFDYLGISLDEPDSRGARYLMHYMRWNYDLFTSDKHAGANLKYRIRQGAADFGREPLERAFDHHLVHAATGCFTSPFEEAVCFVADGSGSDMKTNSFYKYQKGKLEPIPAPAGTPLGYGSLGFFYLALCEACGFDPTSGEEWKVMGLAPYGRLDPELHELMTSMYVHTPLSLVPARDFAAKLTKLFERRRPAGAHPREAADMAFTGQRVFGELSKMLLDDLYALGIS